MNKLYILISLLLPISVASLAMEAPEKEKETEKIRTSRTVRLSAEEAQKLYWDTIAVGGVTGKQLPYEEYRANLMAVIPLMGFTQSRFSDPLADAVHMRDTEFVKFLLEHGADPDFRGMNSLSAHDYLDPGCAGKIRRAKNPYPGSVEEIQALLNKYSAQIKCTKYRQ